MNHYGTTYLISGMAGASIIALEGVRHLRKGMRDGRIFITIGVCIAANAILNVVLQDHRSRLSPAAFSCLYALNIFAALGALTLFLLQITRELRGTNRNDKAEPTSAGDVATRAAPEK